MPENTQFRKEGDGSKKQVTKENFCKSLAHGRVQFLETVFAKAHAKFYLNFGGNKLNCVFRSFRHILEKMNDEYNH